MSNSTTVRPWACKLVSAAPWFFKLFRIRLTQVPAGTKMLQCVWVGPNTVVAMRYVEL